VTGRVVTRPKSRTAPVATIGGLRTRVLESDGGGSTVLLVQGYSDSADGWRAVMDRVAHGGHRAVAVDLPYHGRAERPSGTSFFGVIDDFVAAAVEKYGDGADVAVVGNSVGGRGNQIFWQSSCASANSYYFDKNGDVPLRPTTTLESAIRSRRFKLDDYAFDARASANFDANLREVASK
jgi:pimeloyl-ACP methyl ester carboxylesterase